MNVIRYTIYLEHFVFICLDDTRDELMEPVFPFFPDECSAIFHRKDKLNMDLSVGICHVIRIR